MDGPAKLLDGGGVRLRLALRRGVEGGRFFEHEPEGVSDGCSARPEQVYMRPWQHKDHTRSEKELVPWHLRMKQAGRSLSRDDHLHRSGERSWNESSKGGQRADAGQRGAVHLLR